jgi:hypothetical protein
MRYVGRDSVIQGFDWVNPWIGYKGGAQERSCEDLGQAVNYATWRDPEPLHREHETAAACSL